VTKEVKKYFDLSLKDFLGALCAIGGSEGFGEYDNNEKE